MENSVVEAAENVFNDIPVLPYRRRRTLPEKIIRLRKISQQDHVLRIRTASRNKQMQELQGSSSLSTSFSSTSSGNRRTSSPNLTTNCRNAGKYFDADKQKESSPFTVSNLTRKDQHFNDRNKDCQTRFTNANRLKKIGCFSAANNWVMSDTALDLCCRKKSMIHPNCKINKLCEKSVKMPHFHDERKINDENENKNDENQKSPEGFLRVSTLSKGSWKPFDSIMDSIHLNRLKMKKEESCGDSLNRSLEDSLNRSFENLHLKDKINPEAKNSNKSKIPILQTRLSSEKKNQTNHYFQMKNICNSGIKNTEKIQHSPNVSSMNGSFENAKTKTQKGSNRTSETSFNEGYSKDFKNTSEENSLNENGFNSKINGKLMSNSMSSISSCLHDSIAKVEESNKSSTVLPMESLVADFKRSMENLSQKCSETNETLKINVFKTTSSLTYSLKDSCSGSDESLDFYDTETGNEGVKNIPNKGDQDQNGWEEVSDDDFISWTADIEDKMISTPDNKVKNKYSEAPDYPKTPYDLRYPRYYCRESNDTTVRKVEKNSIECKTPKKKIRKKSHDVLPKRKKGKKSKSNISRKRQASKNKIKD